jgi:hypothetical protein
MFELTLFFRDLILRDLVILREGVVMSIKDCGFTRVAALKVWLFEVFWVCFLGLYPVFCFLFLSV